MVLVPRRDLVWLLLEVVTQGYGPERAPRIANAAGIDLYEEATRAQ
jgi:hypothetical protein